MGLTLEIPNIGEAFFQNSLDVNVLSFQPETAMVIYDKRVIRAPQVAQNELGMYSFANVRRDGSARFVTFGVPSGTMRLRQSPGCVWTPKGSVPMESDSIDTCPIEIEMERCPDELWGGCWEKLLAIGNGKRDLRSTTEANALMAHALKRMMTGIGNDYYMLTHFGQHPVLDQADTNDWFLNNNIDPSKWDDFKEQQDACSGLITTIDALKAQGYDNYNVKISTADVNGTQFIGDTFALFRNLVDRSTMELKTWGKTLEESPPILAVTRSIFNRYKEQLTDQYNTIPQSYFLFTESETGVAMPMRGVLQWDGYWVVCMDAWDVFSNWTGTHTHRAVLLAPGAFGIAYDVAPTEQFNGMGLRVTQRLMPPYKGKTYFDTTFRAGAAILDKDYVTNASLILGPEDLVAQA